MDERAIRETLHSAANGAVLPERFRSPSRLLREAKPPRFAGPRLALAAASVAAALLLAVTPAGQALAQEAAVKIKSVWTGLVGGTPGEVLWVQQDIRESKLAVLVPMETVATVAEAEAKVGFRPVASSYPEAKLDEIQVTIAPTGEYESRWVTLRYLVEGRYYELTTMTHYMKRDGEWRPIPQTNLKGWAVSTQPTKDVRKAPIGGTEGLMFEVNERSIDGTPYWRTEAVWLKGQHQMVRLWGKEPGVVEALARAAE